MQKVSQAYKDSMKSPLRERAYIMLSFGLVNQEAQAKAKMGTGDYTYYSNKAGVFSEKADDTVYATLEEDFTKVDGSMFFLPRKESLVVPYDTGLIGNKLVSEEEYRLRINLNMAATDIKGLTINFGENYPVDFDIVGSKDQKIQIRDNNQSKFVTEDVIEDTTSIELIIYRMKNTHSRLRIYSIRFGYGLVYSNDSVMSSSLTSYISPIGADLPQIDFSVQLKNYDHYFNVDNPDSAINFFETGQEMNIFYGYQLPNSDEIEWIQGNRLYCSEWESDDFTATIRCQDIFRNMDSEYYKGNYNTRSYYDLALEVLTEAGVENYYIDPYLKDLFTTNPLPRVTHKEALQMIANACRCTLSQTRLGEVRIKSSFIPDVSIGVNGETEYSNIANVLNNTVKAEYASLGVNHTPVNGDVYFLPRDIQDKILNTGYISNAVSNENCEFETNPVMTISLEAATTSYGAKLVFGYALPSEMTIRTYNADSLINTYEIREITRNLVVHEDFYDFDRMEIEFTKTADPYNRIVVDYFSLGDLSDFTMTRNDMTSSPKAIKQELVKDIIVPCYSYQSTEQEDTLLSEDISVMAGEEITFFLDEPCYDYRVTLGGSTSGANIKESGSYYITVVFSNTGTFQLELFGHRYKIVERYATRVLNSKGKTIKWENPLMSDITMAQDLAEWLGEYYSSGIEYDYSTRGNPEIDANDVVYQENEFDANMMVTIYRYTLNFNQSFSGKVTARRKVGES